SITVPCTLKTLGRTTITAVDPESGTRGEVPVEVGPGPVKRLAILLPPGGVARGTPVPIAVAAQDGAGNPVPSFTGKVELSIEGNGVPLPPAHEFAAFERGRHTFSRVVFPSAGEFSISANGPNGATGSLKVQVADAGVRGWLWAGPFGPSKGTPAIDPDALGGEAKLAPAPGLTTKGKRWTPMLSGGDGVDLTASMPKDQGVVYAVVYVDSPSEREAELWFGSENFARVLWNGAALHKVDKKRAHTAFEDHVKGVKLARGVNRLAVKLLYEGAGVRFSAKFVGSDGKPFGDLTYSVAPPDAPPKATIAGCVRVKGQPVPGVPVALSGHEKLSTTTGPDGRFEFTGLAPGAFTIKPSLPKVTFDPEGLKIDLAAEDVLDAVFGLSDSVPPAVKLLAPKSSAKAAGMTLLSAEAGDNVGVRSVRFLVDGEAVVPPIARAPYQASIDANSLPPGTHRLVVEVEDLSGNRAETKPLSLTVVVDKTPPVAQVAHPKSGQTVKEKIDLAARVGDDVSVASVQWYVDDKAVGGPQTAAPWSVPWTPDRNAKG
ncbi:MAG: Ig-like domain-containing protein, partial [Planctomycetota bacterium]